METNKVIVIAVVAVVIAAGIGVAMLVMNDSKERISIDAALEVYGNANNDNRIDQADIDLIRDIIAGDASFGDHPLADANHDGYVNEEDIEQVTRMINANSNNKVRIYHINHYDGERKVEETLYPITSAIATGAANSLLIFKYLGIVDELKGISYSSAPDSALFPEYMGLVGEDKRLDTSATRINVDKASNLVDRDGVTAAITADNRSYLQNEEILLEGAGIDVIRVQPASVDSREYMSTVLLIAFLFDTDGKGYMDKCAAMTEWYEDFLTDLNSKLSGIRNKATAVASSSNNVVSTGSSDYTDVLRAAGALFPLTDIDAASATANYNGSSDTWLNAYDVDYVICLRTSTTAFSWYGGTALTDGASTLRTYANNWRTLECYENNNVYVICGDMPVMLRIAYVAQTLYGDVFGPDYAYDLHVEFAEKFFGWDESMIRGKAFVASMEALGIAQ